MKRMLLAVLAVLAGLVFIDSTFADEKKATAPTTAPAGEMKKDEGKKDEGKKGKKAKKNGGFERIPRGGEDPPAKPAQP